MCVGHGTIIRMPRNAVSVRTCKVFLQPMTCTISRVYVSLCTKSNIACAFTTVS